MPRHPFRYLLILFSICITPVWPESQSQYKVTLSGRLRAWDAHRTTVPAVHIFYDGSATPQDCVLDREVSPNGAFACSNLFTQQGSPQIARIEIALPGFKKYSLNITSLEFHSAGASPLIKTQRHTSSVDLGI